MPKKLNSIVILSAMSALVAVTAASAETRGRRDGTGPVGVACQADIEQVCKGLSHGAGAVRKCLEANKSKVSKACAAALDGTGRGRR